MAKTSELAFVVYLIHTLSEAWKMATPNVYALLKTSGTLDKYVIPFYDVLHTCGSRYLVEDITGYLTERGYKL